MKGKGMEVLERVGQMKESQETESKGRCGKDESRKHRRESKGGDRGRDR
jgi:hypothetical protein